MSSGLLLALFACTGPDSDSSSPTDELRLTDANNFAYSGDLSIAATPVEAQQDLDIDWSAVTIDLQGQPLDPATGVDQLELVVFRYLSQDEVEDALSDDTLLQADIALFMQHFNVDEDTSASLSEFSLGSNNIDISGYFLEEYGTWLLLLAEGTTPGSGTQKLHFLSPLEGESNHQVTVDDDSTVLDFDVSLHDLESVSVAAGQVASIDWSGLEIDGRGNPIDLGSIDELWLAHYEATALSELEDGFLGLEQSASELFTLATAGSMQADLSNLDPGGAQFSGPTTDGTWLLSLRCTTCFNPAPPFLTVLDVR